MADMNDLQDLIRDARKEIRKASGLTLTPEELEADKIKSPMPPD
jgi:hypothetical protein